METQETEIWKSLPAPYSMYEASNQGNIRHLKIYKSGLKKWVYLETLTIRTAGYPFINLYGYDEDGKLMRASVSVGRAVLMAWDPREDYTGLDCAHLNGETTDNRIENLQWMSRAENNKGRIMVHKESPKTGCWIVFNDGTIKLFNRLRDITDTGICHYSTLMHLLHHGSNSYKESSEKYGIARAFYNRLDRIPMKYRHKILNMYDEQQKLWE